MTPSATDFHVCATPLRDGAQREGVSYSVADKLAVARLLDEIGVGYIEGGWPGALPKDTEFFSRARTELKLRHAQLVAFGSTRRAGVRVEDDPQVRALLDAETPVVCLVAKSVVRHVREALRTTLEENLAMVRDTVELSQQIETGTPYSSSVRMGWGAPFFTAPVCRFDEMQHSTRMRSLARRRSRASSWTAEQPWPMRRQPRPSIASQM